MHNAGFLAVDRIASELGAQWRISGDAARTDCDLEGRRVVLVKPLTFMNLSGFAVAPLFRKRAEEPEDLVVVHDDLDLSAGTVRLKRGGGAGGHNGLKSLSVELGTTDFLRIRIGIGRPSAGMDPADYVLAPPDAAARIIFEEAVAAAVKAAGDIAGLGFDKAMTRWNMKARTPRTDPPAGNILLAPGETTGGLNSRKEATPHDDSEEV
ncbi:MAG: aminoacyl-tRNA hydrolase [Syntrophorhabdaceae bacterium]|nr:aminoacyl-tRNA hydrolase [Syntrophorhabdaceae bacterium]